MCNTTVEEHQPPVLPAQQPLPITVRELLSVDGDLLH